jgi:hypothetical protein
MSDPSERGPQETILNVVPADGLYIRNLIMLQYICNVVGLGASSIKVAQARDALAAGGIIEGKDRGGSIVLAKSMSERGSPV